MKICMICPQLRSMSSGLPKSLPLQKDSYPRSLLDWLLYSIEVEITSPPLVNLFTGLKVLITIWTYFIFCFLTVYYFSLQLNCKLSERTYLSCSVSFLSFRHVIGTEKIFVKELMKPTTYTSHPGGRLPWFPGPKTLFNMFLKYYICVYLSFDTINHNCNFNGFIKV